MTTENKRIAWGAAALAAVLLIGFGIWRVNNDSKQSSQNQNHEPTLSDLLGNPNASLPEQAAASTSSAPRAVAVKQPSKAYTDALAAYPYRIQFTECHGVVNIAGTGTLTVKKGSKIMLDNRDPVSHTIAFKGVSIKIGAENFTVVTANTLGTYPVTCDGGGAATLKVEP